VLLNHFNEQLISELLIQVLHLLVKQVDHLPDLLETEQECASESFRVLLELLDQRTDILLGEGGGSLKFREDVYNLLHGFNYQRIAQIQISKHSPAH